MSTYKAGRYLADVVEQGFVEAGTGTPGFFLQLRVCNAIDPDGNLRECPQYERTYCQWLKNDVGANILKGDLKILEVEITDLCQLDPETANHKSLVGKRIDVVCTIEHIDGREVERWSIPRPRKKLNLEAIRALDEQLGHVFRDSNIAKAVVDIVVPAKDVEKT